MPRNNKRKKTSKNKSRAKAMNGPLDYKTVNASPPDQIVVHDTSNFNLVAGFAANKTWFFRPTTYADTSATFAFFGHNYFVNIVQTLPAYYDTVEITSHEVVY